MTQHRLLSLPAGLLLALGTAQAQDGSPAGLDVLNAGRSYQVFGRSGNVQALDGGFGNQVVKGKPFSATEERHFLQVLGDGTRIETKEVNRLYRDGQGRTRVEEMDGHATIVDPVAEMQIDLDPAARTARTAPGALAGLRTRVINGGGGAYVAGIGTPTPNGGTLENFKAQTVNGVMAQGTRTTITIPRGDIGNNRDIKVVTERWFSESLQMLIKSTNSDPRFGETTYQLTGILEVEPDAGLFQIPSGYTILAPGARGGRGKAGAPPPAPVPPGAAPRGGGRSATKSKEQ